MIRTHIYILQINRQIVAARTGLNISEDRATIRGKEGMDCSAVLLGPPAVKL